ncbi:hypothetical protein NKR23_g3974 [Pleurostoma richardsiae]|uniref:Centromere protein X n=1 Tax=Pleurostoma richardsiae TaxID=41990 RepID=A0AA38RK91_9PEZI|nr:hypothetical protein NKR23_g3974 [Pleurostoma richardsiae]
MGPRTSTSGRGRSPSVGKPRQQARPESDVGRGVFGSTSVDEEPNEGADESQQRTIPAELLTRILHGFFEKQSTRITRDSNAAVTKYIDVFVREAIARAAAEKDSGFLEVEDLEKVAPQLLLDL